MKKTLHVFILLMLWMMKKPNFLCLVALCFASLTLATPVVNSQNLLDKKISVHFKNVMLKQALDKIASEADVRFAYSGEVAKRNTVISIEAKSKTLRVLLNEILESQPVSYTVVNDEVIFRYDPLKLKKEVVLPVVPVPYVIISGRVTDNNGDPLPRASVRIKETSIGVPTDNDGKFKLKVEAGQVIVISYVGFETTEIIISSDNIKEFFSISLKPKDATINEVVVTGYQVFEKRKLTSAVTTIKMDSIRVGALNTVDQMLEGRVPGMIYMQNSGQVGATPRLRIRGNSTILGSQEPLWVVDGIVQTDPINVDPSKLNDLDFVNLLGNAISGLNPDDVEQIDVLKDASATALYGSKAANGVIVITTKKGKIGPPTITYSLTSTYARRPRYTDKSVDMMNSKQRIAFSRDLMDRKIVFPSIESWVGYEGAVKSFDNGDISAAQMAKQVGYYETLNTDWFKILCQDAISQKHTIGISGGSQDTRYYASIGYNDLQGNIKGELNKQYTANLKINTAYKKLIMQFALQANVSEKKYTPTDVGVMNYAYNTSRAVPVYNTDGSLWYYGRTNSHGDYYGFNIVNEMNNTYDNINSNEISLSTNIDYRISNPLKFGVTLAYSVANTDEGVYHGYNSFYAASLRNENQPVYNQMPYGGELQENGTRKNSYMFRGQFDYNKFLDNDRKHNITAVLGGEISSTAYTGLSQTHRGYLPDRGETVAPVDLTTYNAYATWTQTAAALGVRTDQQTNMASGYASASYSYKDLYILNANARADYSNKFGSNANNKFLPVWSVSGRWDVADDILKGVKWVNTLSLRASYGWQGNMLDNATTQTLITKGSINPVFGEYMSTIYAFSNPNLKWEKTSSTNVTMDFSLFNSKIVGNITYYYKKTTDAFLSKTVSTINGVNTYTVNSGTVENKGVELSFNFVPINHRISNPDGFRWNIDPQIGQVVNSLLSKVQGSSNLVTDPSQINFIDYLNGNVKTSGNPLYSFYSYKYMGLSSTDGSPLFYGTNKTTDKTVYDATGKKEDVFLAVMDYSGSRVPVIQGGLSNTFSYKSFTFNFNLAYSLGSKVRLAYLYPDLSSGSIAPQPTVNARKEMINRWQYAGDEAYTNIPGVVSNLAFSQSLSPWWGSLSYKFSDNIWQMYNNSNIRVVSGDYLRLQSASFRYNISNRFCKTLSLKSAYMGLSATNLFTICSKKLRGQDPTISGTSSAINMSLRPTYAINFTISF